MLECVPTMGDRAASYGSGSRIVDARDEQTSEHWPGHRDHLSEAVLEGGQPRGHHNQGAKEGE